MRQANVNLQHAESRLAQKRKLFEQKALSRAELLDVQSRYEQASTTLIEAQLPVSDSRVHVARRALELVEQDYVAQHAELDMNCATKDGALESARRELAGLELERSQSILRAPHDGVIITPAVKVGDVLERGRPAVKVAARTGFHFEVAVPSGDVGQLRTGMPVRIKFDDFDYQEYGTLDGTVCFISPDSRPAEQREGGAPVYKIEIELAGELVSRDTMHGEIKLGMSGQAEIITDQKSLLALFLSKIRQTISLG